MAGGRGAARARSWFDYRLDVSDGSREVDGGLSWQTVAERNGGRSRIILNIEEFSRVAGRFFRIEWDVGFEALPRDNLGDALLSELQLYGEGYQPRVELTSSLIQLGGSRNLTTIEWDADHPPATGVEVQTRTGNSLDTLLHYFKADGNGDFGGGLQQDPHQDAERADRSRGDSGRGLGTLERAVRGGLGQRHHFALAAQVPPDPGPVAV